MNNWNTLTVDGLTVDHWIDLHADSQLVRLTAVLRSTQLARLGATNAVAQLTLHAMPTERGEYLSNDQLGVNIDEATLAQLVGEHTLLNRVLSDDDPRLLSFHGDLLPLDGLYTPAGVFTTPRDRLDDLATRVVIAATRVEEVHRWMAMVHAVYAATEQALHELWPTWMNTVRDAQALAALVGEEGFR